MIEKPDTFRALIETLGGVKSFSEQMKIGEFAAKKMRDRNAVAMDHWPQLIRVSRANGFLFTTDDFVEMSQFRIPEKPRRRKVAAEQGRAA